jgi:hypothetical protein
LIEFVVKIEKSCEREEEENCKQASLGTRSLYRESSKAPFSVTPPAIVEYVQHKDAQRQIQSLLAEKDI